MIINECIEPVPVSVQPTWPAIVERSLYVAVRSAEAIALRHLYALAEATKLRGDGDVKVRWVAVPQTWRPLNDQFFNEAPMRRLSDGGTNWRCALPLERIMDACCASSSAMECALSWSGFWWVYPAPGSRASSCGASSSGSRHPIRSPS